MCDAGTRLLFKLHSGIHGLHEELGKHRGREGDVCVICAVRTVKVWGTFG